MKRLKSMIEAEPYFGEVKVVEDCVLEESKQKLPKGIIMQLEMKVGHAGRVTKNGRLYRPAVMAREIARIQEDLKTRRVFGLCGHPRKGEQPDPKRREFILTGLKMEDDGGVWATADVLNTAVGKDLAEVARADAKVGFSQRGNGLSNTVVFTDKHPHYAGNESWAGQKIEDVEEQYILKSFDDVLGQAVTDAELSGYNENESEDDMEDFKLENLKDEQWTLIEGSERFKKAVTAAMDEAIDAKVNEVVNSPEFGERMAKNEKFVDTLIEKYGGDEDDKEDKGECTTCKKEIVEGATFCPGCGARQMVEGTAPDKPADEKDAKLVSLVESNVKLQKTVDVLVAKDKSATDKIATDKVIEEAVQDKAAHIQKAVRELMERRTYTLEDVAEVVKQEVTFAEANMPKEAPKGKGHSQPGDEKAEGDDKDDKEDPTKLTEQEQGYMDTMRG